MYLPVNYKLQDDRQDIQYEGFDAVEIDSIGYKEMMDLGIKARQENNLPHAIAYFKEAYHINPYSIEPIENITALNTAVGKEEDNQAVYEYAIDELTRWNRLNGTGNSAVEPMEYFAVKMKSIDANDIYPRTSLLWTYLETRNSDYEMKVENLLDELIPTTEKQELWPQYGYLMSLRACFIDNEEGIIPFVEPNADKLAKSPQSVGALVMLSRMYREQNDNAKADKFMKMAEQADPERQGTSQMVRIIAKYLLILAVTFVAAVNALAMRGSSTQLVKRIYISSTFISGCMDWGQNSSI